MSHQSNATQPFVPHIFLFPRALVLFLQCFHQRLMSRTTFFIASHKSTPVWEVNSVWVSCYIVITPSVRGMSEKFSIFSKPPIPAFCLWTNIFIIFSLEFKLSSHLSHLPYIVHNELKVQVGILWLKWPFGRQLRLDIKLHKWGLNWHF